MTGRFQLWLPEACVLATLSAKDAYGYETTKINALCASESTNILFFSGRLKKGA